MAGVFQIDREIFDNSIWQNPAEFRLFFYILGNAVWKDEGIKFGNLLVKRGQYLRSYRNLREDLMYTENNAIKYYSLSHIKKLVDKLANDGRVEKEETELGTLFTVVNYSKYQGFDRFENDDQERRKNEERTEQEQNENNKKKDKKDKNENNNIPSKKESKIFTSEDKEYLLAEYLSKQISKHLDKPLREEKDLQKWANEFEKMVRLDKYDINEIKEVLVFSQKNDFWQTNILSANKFRKQYLTLLAQMKREYKKGGDNGGTNDNGIKFTIPKVEVDTGEDLDRTAEELGLI